MWRFVFGEGLAATRRFLALFVFTVSLLLVPRPAKAFELSGGVSIGGILVGTDPRLAVTPHVGIAWRAESGFMLAARDLFSIVPATNQDGVGVYNETAAGLGYASESVGLTIGPSLAIYSMPACGTALCGRVVGLAPGGHAELSVYLVGPLGVSANANVDWIGGRSRVLPGGVAAMVLIGPVLRWERSST